MSGRTNDYTTVTEVPGAGASREQLSMLYTRYRTAAGLAAGRDVLEVACGAGSGLGYLAGRAGRVVGGDYTHRLLVTARRHYGARVPLLRLDAQRLPFANERFDLVILYEALYYLARAEQFVAESRRVLRPEGTLLICTVNREWTDFNPSPFSTRYLSASELRDLLAEAGFQVELFGAFPTVPASMRERAISHLKRAAVGLGLIPRTMKGKHILKRLLFGRLVPLPAEITDGMAEVAALVPLDRVAARGVFKVIYAVGRLEQARRGGERGVTMREW